MILIVVYGFFDVGYVFDCELVYWNDMGDNVLFFDMFMLWGGFVF